MLSSRGEAKPFNGKLQIFITRGEFQQLYESCQRGKYIKSQNSEVLLLCSKAYFLEKKYEQTISILEKIRHDQSTKILYQRQALLFKTAYLLYPKDKNYLRNIIDEYFYYRNRCPGRKLTNFHDTMIKNLQSFIERDKLKSNLSTSQVKAKCKELGKKMKFEGMKSFLIERSWNERWTNYINKDKEHPGPISNFTLLNHIFQFEPPREKRRSYMETILFPITQQIHYVSVTKQHWDFIHSLYSGYPIQRLFFSNVKSQKIQGGDHLAKIAITFQQQLFIFHEQIGTYWQNSVFPRFIKVFGTGQLKQQTQNKDQYLIVKEGCVYQPYTPFKYVRIPENLIKAQTDEEKRKREKLIMRYDMEGYDIKKATNGQIGLANLGNTCYMNASLQCLSNIKKLRDYFLGQNYLHNINLSETNKVGSFGSVTCAFASLIKRLWLSSENTRYIDPVLFKKAFQTRFQQFRGYDQEDAHQFMSFLLNCLHDDLNAAKVMFYSVRQFTTEIIYENARNQAISNHEKRNKSIINDMFMGHLFEEIQCQNCKKKRFKFQIFMMLQVQVPLDSSILKFFLVVGGKYNEQALNWNIYLNGIENVGQALNLIKKKRSTKDMKYYMCLVDRSDYKVEEFFDEETDIKKIVKQNRDNCHLFVYELPQKISEGQAFFCFQYAHDGKPRGFPRILPLNKNLWNKKLEKSEKKEKLQILKKYAAQTLILPIIEDKMERIEEIKCQSEKNKIFSFVVAVQLKANSEKFFNCTQPQPPFGNQPNQHDRSLQSCLNHLQQPQMITQQEAWQCEGCKKQTTAIRKSNLHSTGEILAIVFKRFTEEGKITTKISYPLDNLNIKKYIHEPKQKEIYNYQLIGVVLHRGQLNYGHYTSICLHPTENKWYNYDDEHVRSIPEENVINEAAYILFYQRK